MGSNSVSLHLFPKAISHSSKVKPYWEQRVQIYFYQLIVTSVRREFNPYVCENLNHQNISIFNNLVCVLEKLLNISFVFKKYTSFGGEDIYPELVIDHQSVAMVEASQQHSLKYEYSVSTIAVVPYSFLIVDTDIFLYNFQAISQPVQEIVWMFLLFSA